MSDKTIYFFSGSADVPAGRGCGVNWKESGWSTAESSLPANFRRFLTRTDTSQLFWHEGRFFRSMEHALHFQRLTACKKHTEAYEFCCDSGSALGRGSGTEAEKKGSLIELAPEDIMRWDTISMDAMASIARSKFLGYPDSTSANVLKLTQDARLFFVQTNKGRPSSLVRYTHLEEIRAELLGGGKE